MPALTLFARLIALFIISILPPGNGQLSLPTTVAMDRSSQAVIQTQYNHVFPDVFTIGGVLSTHRHRHILEQVGSAHKCIKFY